MNNNTMELIRQLSEARCMLAKQNERIRMLMIRVDEEELDEAEYEGKSKYFRGEPQSKIDTKVIREYLDMPRSKDLEMKLAALLNKAKEEKKDSEA